MVRYFDRNEEVVVQIGTGAVFARGRVLLDTGGEKIVVDRHGQPTKLTRVARNRVKPPPAEPEAVKGPVQIACLDTEHGRCALQVQSRTVSRAECIQGVWTICGTWATASTKPKQSEPTCPTCRKHLGMQ